MIWHSNLIARWMAFVLFVSALVMSVESAELADVQKISDETAVLRERKNIVLQTYQINAKACWQLFAVNDCLAKVQREKYQNLAPIEQLEIALNAKRRALKEAERLERLSDKSAPLQNSPHSIKVAP
jgi:hypothetical protein